MPLMAAPRHTPPMSALDVFRMPSCLLIRRAKRSLPAYLLQRFIIYLRRRLFQARLFHIAITLMLRRHFSLKSRQR